MENRTSVFQYLRRVCAVNYAGVRRAAEGWDGDVGEDDKADLEDGDEDDIEDAETDLEDGYEDDSENDKTDEAADGDGVAQGGGEVTPPAAQPLQEEQDGRGDLDSGEV